MPRMAGGSDVDDFSEPDIDDFANNGADEVPAPPPGAVSGPALPGEVVGRGEDAGPPAAAPGPLERFAQRLNDIQAGEGPGSRLPRAQE